MEGCTCEFCTQRLVDGLEFTNDSGLPIISYVLSPGDQLHPHQSYVLGEYVLPKGANEAAQFKDFYQHVATSREFQVYLSHIAHSVPDIGEFAEITANHLLGEAEFLNYCREVLIKAAAQQHSLFSHNHLTGHTLKLIWQESGEVKIHPLFVDFFSRTDLA